MEDSGRVVVVLAKAPHPGLVKTRMSPPLEPDQAAELYGHLLDDVLEATAEAAEVLALTAVLSVHPADACAEVALRAPSRFRVVAQRGRDLGQRMAWAVREAAAGGARRILLRGSDSPLLGRPRLERALEGLEDHDLVIAPDRDGGYGLLGLRAPVPGLFDHPMSTATVFDEALANARRSGLRTRTLEPSFDLDTVGDFAHLERAREAGDAALCPRTLAYLDRLALWRHTGG